jgi:hypothetical protein
MPSIDQFVMPPAGPQSLEILKVLPSWLGWLGRLISGWATSTRFEIDGEGLRILGTVYGRRFSWAELQTDAATAVDLTVNPTKRPMVRTRGVGLPGFGAGWFLSEAGVKLLAFFSSMNTLVEIPTRLGYVLLLSVVDRERFLERLRERASESRAQTAL